MTNQASNSATKKEQTPDADENDPDENADAADDDDPTVTLWNHHPKGFQQELKPKIEIPPKHILVSRAL